MRAIVIASLLALGCSERTQLMFGVATDLDAPDQLDVVQLDITRLDNGQPVVNVRWDISGNSEPFNLPGSFGVFSDGEEFQLDVRVSGEKGGVKLLDRRSIVGLVEDETLFYRISLSGLCIGREDCPEDFSCVEGVCRDSHVPSNQLPDFEDSLVSTLTCNPGVSYIQTETGEAMSIDTEAAAECPAGLCLEGTCLKPPPATQSGTRTVRGSKIRTFVQPNNQLTNVPFDLSALEIAALVTDAGGNTTTLPGVGNADGTFAIQNVPNGKYVLKVGTNYTVTFADNVDLGFLDLGRPNKNQVTNTATTGFNLNVTGMSPWQDGNLLSAYSPEANSFWFFFDENLAVAPAINDTALTNAVLTYDAESNAGTNLIENDAFALLQYTNKNAGDPDATKYQVATKMLVPAPFKMVNGQLTQLTGAFTDVPQTETISFDIRQGDWERAVGWNGTNPLLINPTAVPVDFSIAGVTGDLGGVNIDVFGQPGGGQYGQFSATVDYLFITAQEGKDSTFSNLTYGKPHVSAHTFSEMMFSSIGYEVTYQLPGSAGAAHQFLDYSTIRAVSSDLVVVTPLLGPVRDAAINDRDVFTQQQDVSPTSRISWKAPALGNASLYSVRFFKLGVNGNNQTRGTQVASVTTTDTFLDVPPGILEPGQSYYFIIAASDGGNIDAPFRSRLPESTAPVASAIMVIGNGGGNVPGVDAGTGAPDAPGSGICDLELQQGCPGGAKCTVFGGTEILCRPEGSVPLDGTCTGNDNQDDCRTGGICIFRQCREFCGGNHTCGAGEKCISFGTFSTCLSTCNPLSPSCPATAESAQNCYENTDGTPNGTCINSGTNTPVGQTCGAANACAAGAGCIGNKCLAYCNFAMFPNTQGTCAAGQTCQDLGNADGVGACAP